MSGSFCGFTLSVIDLIPSSTQVSSAKEETVLFWNLTSIPKNIYQGIILGQGQYIVEHHLVHRSL